MSEPLSLSIIEPTTEIDVDQAAKCEIPEAVKEIEIEALKENLEDVKLDKDGQEKKEKKRYAKPEGLKRQSKKAIIIAEIRAKQEANSHTVMPASKLQALNQQMLEDLLDSIPEISKEEAAVDATVVDQMPTGGKQTKKANPDVSARKLDKAPKPPVQFKASPDADKPHPVAVSTGVVKPERPSKSYYRL